MKEYYYKGIIDSHIHLDCLISKGFDVDNFLDKSLNQNNILAMIDIATSDKDFENRLILANKYKNLYLSCGIDPSNIDKGCEISNIVKQVQNKKVILVGEIGIDLYWRQDNLNKQIELFEKQIIVANDFSLPISVHNREADKEIKDTITRTTPSESGIIHCFSSNWDFGKKMLDLGFYLSFSGNITYKKSEQIRETAKNCPLNKILIETDAPYLAPQPFRGEINNSLMMGHQVDTIANLKGITVDEVIESQIENFETLFKLDLTS